MKIGDVVKKWVFTIALKKGIVSASKLVVSYCAAKGLIFAGTFFGMVIDTGNVASIEAFITWLINSGLTMVRNWVKVKFGIGWL